MGARGLFIFGRTDGTFGTSGTCGTRMRRNQKIFSSVAPEGGSRTTKDILKKSLPFGQPLSYESHKSYKSYKSHKSCKSHKCAGGTV